MNVRKKQKGTTNLIDGKSDVEKIRQYIYFADLIQIVYILEHQYLFFLMKK